MAIRLSNIKANGDLYKSSYSGEVEGKLDWSVFKKKWKERKHEMRSIDNFCKELTVRRVEESNTSCKGKCKPYKGFSIYFLLLLFLKKRTITENADEKDPIKGKINDVGQSSKNYDTWARSGLLTTFFLSFFFFFFTVDYFYSSWAHSDVYISKWLKRKIKRKIFYDIRKLCQIQISVSTNKVLLESSHTQHILTVYDYFCSTMTELSCCGKRLYVTFYWFPLLHRALWITMIEL